MLYQFCIDCGKPKELNKYRNCKVCMKKVIASTLFNECQRCHKGKRKTIWGLCLKCKEEIEYLNSISR